MCWPRGDASHKLLRRPAQLWSGPDWPNTSLPPYRLTPALCFSLSWGRDPLIWLDSVALTVTILTRIVCDSHFWGDYISLFALSDNDSKLPLDVLVSVLTHLSHNGRTRDIRETPGAIVSQLTTVKARPLYVINIHADVVQRCTLCGTLYTVCNDFLYHEHEI